MKARKTATQKVHYIVLELSDDELAALAASRDLPESTESAVSELVAVVVSATS